MKEIFLCRNCLLIVIASYYMFQYWVELSYDQIAFFCLSIGRSFRFRWRNRGDAHPREVVPWQPRLLLELPQHHAHTRRGCRLLHASGETPRFISHTSKFTFYHLAAFNQCKQKPQLNISDPVFRRFEQRKKLLSKQGRKSFQPVGCFWFIDPTIELSFSIVFAAHSSPPRLRQSFTRKMCKRAVTFLGAKYFNTNRKTLENAKV